MNIERIDMECLPKIKNAIKVNIDKYLTSDDYWLEDYIREIGYSTMYSNVDVDELEFSMDKTKPEDTDLDNIKMLYSKLDLAPELAGNGGFWTIISHHYAKFIRYRTKVLDEKDEDKKLEKISSNFVFPNIIDMRKRRHGILPFLWTVGDLTYDADNTGNEYWMTEEALTDLDIAQNIVDRAIFNNKTLVKVFLEHHKKRRESGNEMKREECRSLYKFLQAMNQTVILESYSRKELDEQILEFENWYSKQILSNKS